MCFLVPLTVSQKLLDTIESIVISNETKELFGETGSKNKDRGILFIG